MNTNQILYEGGQSEPMTSLVERIPVKDGTILSRSPTLSWEDLRGLSWIQDEEEW